jgi:hypothetical protein
MRTICQKYVIISVFKKSFLSLSAADIIVICQRLFDFLACLGIGRQQAALSSPATTQKSEKAKGFSSI